MATIGLDKLYYATITDDENGEEINKKIKNNIYLRLTYVR